MNLAGLNLSASTPSSHSGVNGAAGFARIGTGGFNQWFGLSTGSFGAPNNTNASSTTGDPFGVLGSVGAVYLPSNYVSGASLPGASIFSGRILQGLGLTTGTYTFSSLSDLVTVNVGAYTSGAVDNPPPPPPALPSRQITYTLSGLADYTLNGTSYTNTAFSFTGIGDISTRTEPLTDIFSVALSSLTGRFGNIDLSLAGSASFRYIKEAGFGSLQIGGVNGEGLQAPIQFIGAVGLDGVTDFGPASVNYLRALTAAQTSAGTLQFTTARNLIFSAQVAAVPEPTTWAMTIIGCGLIGGTMRRRGTSLAVI